MAQGAIPLADGEILAGKYRVLFVIGEGGMGHVFAAEHIQLGHKVALKVMRPSALASEEAVERFLREGRAAARLQSEHIARVSDVGTLDSGVPYMVMELLQGQDLAHILAEKGKLPIEQAVSYIIQASEAIAEAHRNGIVHRDLKPANLFVTTTLDGAPLVKVLDFGISKASTALLGAEAPQITSTSAMIGSPKYMSPEQMQDSRTVDGRADIWALGAILYELLAGRRAFDATTLATTCVQILQEDPPPVRKSREEVPPELDAVVMRCLEKDPDDRFACIADFVEALSPFARDSQALVARIVRMTTSRPLRAVPAARRSGPSLSEAASSVAAVAAGRVVGEDGRRASDGAIEGARRRGAGGVFRIAAGVAVVVVLAIVGFRGSGRSTSPPDATQAATPPSSAAPAPAPSAGGAPAVTPAPPSSGELAAADAGAAAAIAPAPAVPPSQRRVHPRPRPSANTTGVTDSVLEDRR